MRQALEWVERRSLGAGLDQLCHLFLHCIQQLVSAHPLVVMCLRQPSQRATLAAQQLGRGHLAGDQCLEEDLAKGQPVHRLRHSHPCDASSSATVGGPTAVLPAGCAGRSGDQLPMQVPTPNTATGRLFGKL